MEKEKSSSQVSWNASEGIIMEISNRRSMANSFYIQNNISRAFNTLIAMKQSVIQSFEKKDRDKLEEIEKKFHKISNFLSLGAINSFNSKVREASRLARELANKLYPEYNNLLMDLLQSKGYLVGEKSDSSRMRF
jgi:phosphate uptake regulator